MEKPTPNLADAATYGNLLVAHANARRGKRHYDAVLKFEENQDENLHKLAHLLLSGEYRTSPYVNKVIFDSGKERTISKLPYYPDRIAHWALMMQLEPLFLAAFCNRSHAAIKGHGIHTALYQTRSFMLHYPEKSKYCLKIDIRKYFQSVDRDVLKSKTRELIEDEPLSAAIDEIIDSFPQGIPIGNYTSQYLANFYLTGFDNWLVSRGVLFVRYMDDVVIFGSSTEYLREVLKDIQQHLREELHVELKSSYQIFPTAIRGVDFVGYRIYPNRVLLRKSNFNRKRRKLAKVRKRLEAGIFTQSDQSRIASIAGDIKHCTKNVRKTLSKNYFEEILDLIHGNEQYKRKIKKAFV